MTTVEIVSLCGIVAAFVIFAVVLAWGDYQTRDIRQDKPSEGFKMLKSAADASRAGSTAAKATTK